MIAERVRLKAVAALARGSEAPVCTHACPETSTVARVLQEALDFQGIPYCGVAAWNAPDPLKAAAGRMGRCRTPRQGA